MSNGAFCHLYNKMAKAIAPDLKLITGLFGVLTAISQYFNIITEINIPTTWSKEDGYESR